MTKFGLQDVQFLAAMGPPGGGRNNITTRMSRHLNVITIHEFNNATMSAIFSQIVEIHAARGGYDGNYLQLGKKAVAATLHVFNKGEFYFRWLEYSGIELGKWYRFI